MRAIQILDQKQNLLVRFWIWLTTGQKWEIVEDWHFTLPDGTKIIIPKGFIFDGASIPRPFWSLISPTDLLLIPSLIHDFAYRYDYLWTHSRSGELIKYKLFTGRRHWDRVFRQVIIDTTGMKLVAWVSWLVLRVTGWYAWIKNRRLDADDIYPVNASQ